jgi:sterol desaturase/sphingolipid hydroxylase (fatty acid hydroxylase superfamily)
MEYLQELFASIVYSTVRIGGEYLRYMIPAYLFFSVFLRRTFDHWRIQPKLRTNAKRIFREITNSLRTFTIGGTLTGLLGITLLKNQGRLFYNNIYTNISDYGWGYFCLSIFLLLFLDDAQFYWFHRCMHHPKVFPMVHRVHHESIDPTPFTATSFHPVEAVIQYFGQLLVLSILPVHPAAIAVWFLMTIVNGVYIHLSHEIYPQWCTRFWLTKWKTPSTHHNLHHEKIRGNYALIFTWWDKWMNTEVEDYEERLAMVYNRRNKGRRGSQELPKA